MSIHINNKELTSAFLGNKNVESMYLGDKLLYTAFIKAQFEVVDNNDNISGIYNYAYNKTDKKWYVKNDQNTYEEYGLIPKVTSLETLHKTTAAVVDLNNSWQKSTYWSKAGYDCYESYSNNGVDNSYSTMKVTIPPGMSTFDVIFGSYAESSYDFTLLSALDASKPTSNSSAGAVATSINKQNTQITYTYNITDTSKDHWFWVTYRKDGSNSLGTDRGYLLISSPYTGTSTYKGKLVIYNGDQYMYDGTKWVNKGPTYPLSYEQRPTPQDNLTFTSVSEMKKYPNPYVGMTCTVNGKTYKYSIDGWTYNYIIIGTNTNDQTKNGWLKNNDIKIPLLYGDNPINMKGVYHIYPQYNNITAFNKFNIGTLDSKQLTSCEEMFLCYTGSSLDLSKFDTSNVTNMRSMFRGCQSLTSLDLSKFDTSNVTNMGSMFSGCQSLTSLDLSKFDTSNVTNMGAMLRGCGSLTSLDLSKFDTSNVTNISFMFSDCKSLTSLDLSNFDTSNVATSFYGLYGMRSMFSGCGSLTSLDLSNFDTSKITDMSSMFSDCKSLTSLDLSKFDTSNVTNMSSMFSGCQSLTSLDLSKFDTSNVTNMRSMFSFCQSLTSLDLSNFDTSKITDMRYMFSGCQNLTSLDLSKFDTSNVTDMSYMFSGCGSLTSLDLSNFDTSKITDMSSMFSGCQSLKTVKVTNCSEETQQKILSQLPSYNWTLSNGVITR